MNRLEISKYHKRSYVGKGIKGADENGYEYTWNSMDERLAPTKTREIGYRKYCVYCGEPAYPIQGNIIKYGNYDNTGHCCTCELAEREKELAQEKIDLENRHKEEICAINNKIKRELVEDELKLFELEYSNKRKRILEDIEWRKKCYE